MSLLTADLPDFPYLPGLVISSFLMRHNIVRINLYHRPAPLFAVYCLGSDIFTTPDRVWPIVGASR